MDRSSWLILPVVAIFITAASLVAQGPSIEDVLERAGRRAVAMHVAVPVIVADEALTQIMKPYGSSYSDLSSAHEPLGEMGLPKVRKSKAAYAIAAIPDSDGWATFRDIFEADGKAVHKETDRLLRTFAEPFDSAAVPARTITEASLKFDVGTYPRDVSLAMLPWTMVWPSNQKRFTFKRKGDKKIGDLKTVELEFRETAHPTLGRTADGVDKPSHGSLWIDPETGVVVKASVMWDAEDAYPDMKRRPERYLEFPRATLEITYREDAALKTWVPVEVKELFSRRAEVVICTATYTNFRRVEVKQ